MDKIEILQEITTIAESGLATYNRPSSINTTDYGVNQNTIETATTNLNNARNNISSIIGELSIIRNKLGDGELAGQFADQFNSNINDLVGFLNDVPTTVNDITQWTNEKASGHSTIDSNFAKAIG